MNMLAIFVLTVVFLLINFESLSCLHWQSDDFLYTQSSVTITNEQPQYIKTNPIYSHLNHFSIVSIDQLLIVMTMANPLLAEFRIINQFNEDLLVSVSSGSPAIENNYTIHGNNAGFSDYNGIDISNSITINIYNSTDNKELLSRMYPPYSFGVAQLIDFEINSVMDGPSIYFVLNSIAREAYYSIHMSDFDPTNKIFDSGFGEYSGPNQTILPYMPVVRDSKTPNQFTLSFVTDWFMAPTMTYPDVTFVRGIINYITRVQDFETHNNPMYLNSTGSEPIFQELSFWDEVMLDNGHGFFPYEVINEVDLVAFRVESFHSFPENMATANDSYQCLTAFHDPFNLNNPLNKLFLHSPAYLMEYMPQFHTAIFHCKPNLHFFPHNHNATYIYSFIIELVYSFNYTGNIPLPFTGFLPPVNQRYYILKSPNTGQTSPRLTYFTSAMHSSITDGWIAPNHMEERYVTLSNKPVPQPPNSGSTYPNGLIAYQLTLQLSIFHHDVEIHTSGISIVNHVSGSSIICSFHTSLGKTAPTNNYMVFIRPSKASFGGYFTRFDTTKPFTVICVVVPLDKTRHPITAYNHTFPHFTFYPLQLVTVTLYSSGEQPQIITSSFTVHEADYALTVKDVYGVLPSFTTNYHWYSNGVYNNTQIQLPLVSVIHPTSHTQPVQNIELTVVPQWYQYPSVPFPDLSEYIMYSQVIGIHRREVVGDITTETSGFRPSDSTMWTQYEAMKYWTTDTDNYTASSINPWTVKLRNVDFNKECKSCYTCIIHGVGTIKAEISSVTGSHYYSLSCDLSTLLTADRVVNATIHYKNHEALAWKPPQSERDYDLYHPVLQTTTVSLYYSHIVSVKSESNSDSNSGPLDSTGAKAGLAIGCIVIVILIGFIIYHVIRKRKQKSADPLEEGLVLEDAYHHLIVNA